MERLVVEYCCRPSLLLQSSSFAQILNIVIHCCLNVAVRSFDLGNIGDSIMREYLENILITILWILLFLYFAYGFVE